ncbi:MAG: hypothetical protein JST42_03095, partial [Bacteroidetes bacterium]|nr:hypothetical protein [Bacteroidota bacterium]
YPGQLKKRVFRVVLVGEGKGAGETPVTVWDKVIPYAGKAVVAKVSVQTMGVKPGPAKKVRG